MITVHWTRPVRGHGPTGDHVAVVGDLKAVVRKAKGPHATGWSWHVRDLTRERETVAGNAPTWQAARREAAAVLTAG